MSVAASGLDRGGCGEEGEGSEEGEVDHVGGGKGGGKREEGERVCVPREGEGVC